MNRPKPTALKILHGTAQPSRMNKDEPTPTALSGVPKPPRPLSAAAMVEWNIQAKATVGMKVLTSADLSALALLAEAYGDMVAAKGSDSWRQLESARKFYLYVLREFGLTPSSRTRLHAAPSAKEDPFEKLLAGQREASP